VPRAKGQKNRTTLMRERGIQSALDACSKADLSLPEFLVESIKIVRHVALAPLTRRNGPTRSQAENIAALDENLKDRLVSRLFKASQIAVWLMEFTHPKLARMEHSGLGGGPIEHVHDHSSAAAEYVQSRIDRLVERRREDQPISGPH